MLEVYRLRQSDLKGSSAARCDKVRTRVTAASIQKASLRPSCANCRSRRIALKRGAPRSRTARGLAASIGIRGSGRLDPGPGGVSPIAGEAAPPRRGVPPIVIVVRKHGVRRVTPRRGSNSSTDRRGVRDGRSAERFLACAQQITAV
jgi:hypothetical protein